MPFATGTSLSRAEYQFQIKKTALKYQIKADRDLCGIGTIYTSSKVFEGKRLSVVMLHGPSLHNFQKGISNFDLFCQTTGQFFT